MPSDTPPHPAPPEVDKNEIEVLKALKDDGFAETRLVRYQGQQWLYKVYRFRFWWGRFARSWAARQARHEMAICRQLDGIEGAATRFIQVDRQSFLREWHEGMDLWQCRVAGKRPGADLFVELGRVIEQVHARGVAYNDLAKPDNVVCTPEGRPVLIDFQISMRAYRGENGLRRWLDAKLMHWLRQEDLRHVAKLKRKTCRDPLTPEEHALCERKPMIGTLLRRLLLDPLRALKRVFYPSGSNETFRFGRKKH